MSTFDTIASLPGDGLARVGTGVMKRLECMATGTGSCLAEQVKRQAFINMRMRPNAVDTFLHLAMAAVAALDGIGGGRQQPVIEKGQRLVDIGRKERLQGLADLGKALDPLPQAGEFGQGSGRAAAPVKELVDLIHNGP